MSAVLVMVVAAVVLVAAPGGPDPARAAATPFSDVATNSHRWAIKAMVDEGITQGCTTTRYCPRDQVTRAQMATFLARALNLAPRNPSFSDVSGGPHARNIGAIAAAGITEGCTSTRFCPYEPVTRAQMATFIQRALSLQNGSVAQFSDVGNGHAHARGIGAVARAEITRGCNASQYCPERPVTRDQMATFLARALDLDLGLEGCPAVASTTTQDLGAAARGLPLNSSERIGDSVFVFTLDVSPGRLVTYDLEQNEVTSQRNVTGTRTWATHVMNDKLYFGHWGITNGATNLFEYDPESGNLRPIAAVNTGGEFWSLTSDGEGTLYAGTRHANRVYEIDAQTGSITTRHVTGSPVAGDVTQLEWADGDLYVGLGRQNARMLRVDPESGVVLDDLTPPGVAVGIGIYSLDVNDDYVAFGTQQDAARLVVLDRADDHEVRVDTAFADEPVIGAVAIDDDRVVAAGNGTGKLYEVLPAGPTAPTELATPLPRAPTRSLTLHGGDVVGVTGAMAVWTHGGDGVSVNDIVSAGAAPASLRPQSLSVNGTTTLVGVNNAVYQRRIANPSQSQRTFVPGEPKAAVPGGSSTHLIANYPHATLWRVPWTGDPTLVADWPDVQNRPRDIHRDSANGRVLIGTQSDFSGSAGALVAVNESTGSSTVHADVIPSDVNQVAAHGQRTIVAGGGTGTRVASVGGSGDVVWQRNATSDKGRATGLVVRGNDVHVLTQQGYWFTLDARNGTTLRPATKVSPNNSGELAWKAGGLYAVSRSRLTAIDPHTGAFSTVVDGLGADLFGPPGVRLDDDCRLYVFRGRNLMRVSHDLWSR